MLFVKALVLLDQSGRLPLIPKMPSKAATPWGAVLFQTVTGAQRDLEAGQS